MSIIYILVGASIIVALVFLIGFIWSVKSGQYEDNYSPASRILFEDYKNNKNKPTEETEQQNKIS